MRQRPQLSRFEQTSPAALSKAKCSDRSKASATQHRAAHLSQSARKPPASMSSDRLAQRLRLFIIHSVGVLERGAVEDHLGNLFAGLSVIGCGLHPHGLRALAL